MTEFITQSKQKLRKPTWFLALFVLIAVPALLANTAAHRDEFETVLEDLVMQHRFRDEAQSSLDEETRLYEFYRARQYRPVWIQGGKLSETGSQIIEAIKSSYKVGLNPDNLLLPVIEQHAGSHNKHDRARMEILLSIAYARLYEQKNNGKTTQAVKFEHFYLERKTVDGFKALSDAIAGNQVIETVAGQMTKHAQIEKLEHALEQYRAIAAKGGWPVIPHNALLKPGISDSRISVIKRRMKISGDFPVDVAETPDFDKTLEQAIKHYQERNGLFVDGKLGKETIVELNIPVEQRIQQIVANIERWRQLPAQLGDKYILVNTAGYMLYATQKDQPELRMRVVVGESNWQTPALATRMTQVIVNPDWRVPRKIAIEEILPKLKENAAYLTDNDFHVFGMRTGKPVEIDPLTISWKNYGKSNFPFELVRGSGTKNPLGNVKFVIPNPHDVYLHGTPFKAAFDKNARNLSHGCVRLEKPLDLAKFVLAGEKNWDSENFSATFHSEESQTIQLKNKFPVYLTYNTVWVDDNGQVSFFRDVYNRDQAVVAALNQ